jgi:hypothetical protein
MEESCWKDLATVDGMLVGFKHRRLLLLTKRSNCFWFEVEDSDDVVGEMGNSTGGKMIDAFSYEKGKESSSVSSRFIVKASSDSEREERLVGSMRLGAGHWQNFELEMRAQESS